MSISLLVFLIILVAAILYTIVGLLTKSVDDFFKGIWLKTLWLWLPFHALMRLSHELKDKNSKK